MNKTRLLLRIAFLLPALYFFSEMKAQELLWARSAGTGTTEKGYRLTTDDTGNVYTFGTFSGTADFDPGSPTFDLTAVSGGKSFFIQKLDSTGNFKWAVSFGTASNENMPGSIKLDKLHNILVTGKHIGTMDADPGIGVTMLASSVVGSSFTIKLNNSGEFIWARVVSGQTGNGGTASAVDDSCNVYIVGDFFGSVDFDPGTGTFLMTATNTWNVFYLKLDSSGTFMWAEQIGAAMTDRCTDIEVDALGNFYTCGMYGDMVDIDPGPGVYNLPGGNINLFVGKYDRNGNFLEGTGTTGFLGDVFVKDLVLDNQKNIYVAGRFHGTVDFNTDAGTLNFSAGTTYDNFLVKLDSACSFLWAKQLKSTGPNVYNYGIAVDTSGNVYTVGSFSDSLGIVLSDTTTHFLIAGETEINGYIIKRNSTGTLIWAEQLIGADSNSLMDVSIDMFNSIYTTGYFSGTVDFDFLTPVENLVSSGLGDFFVQKLSTDTVVIVSVPVVSNKYNSILLYPNPSAGTVYISAELNIDKIVITDMLGRTVYESSPNDRITTVGLQTAGLYFVTVSSQGIKTTRKVIIN